MPRLTAQGWQHWRNKLMTDLVERLLGQREALLRFKLVTGDTVTNRVYSECVEAARIAADYMREAAAALEDANNQAASVGLHYQELQAEIERLRAENAAWKNTACTLAETKVECVHESARLRAEIAGLELQVKMRPAPEVREDTALINEVVRLRAERKALQARIVGMMCWLEDNQRDVFTRGIWETINEVEIAARASVKEPT